MGHGLMGHGLNGPFALTPSALSATQPGYGILPTATFYERCNPPCE